MSQVQFDGAVVKTEPKDEKEAQEVEYYTVLTDADSVVKIEQLDDAEGSEFENLYEVELINSLEDQRKKCRNEVDSNITDIVDYLSVEIDDTAIIVTGNIDSAENFYPTKNESASGSISPSSGGNDGLCLKDGSRITAPYIVEVIVDNDASQEEEDLFSER